MARKKKSTRSTTRVQTRSRKTRSTSRKVKKVVARAERRSSRKEIKPEHREKFYRAKRALRALRRHVIFPKAVIHAKGSLPELLEEIPDQALIEHWEALGELKQHGIEIRHTRAEFPRPHFLREVELDAPVSAQARHFAHRYGLLIRERKHPMMSSLERIFG